MTIYEMDPNFTCSDPTLFVNSMNAAAAAHTVNKAGCEGELYCCTLYTVRDVGYSVLLLQSRNTQGKMANANSYYNRYGRVLLLAINEEPVASIHSIYLCVHFAAPAKTPQAHHMHIINFEQVIDQKM